MESAYESELVPHRHCLSRLVTDAGRRFVLRPAHSAVHVDRIARLTRLVAAFSNFLPKCFGVSPCVAR